MESVLIEQKKLSVEAWFRESPTHWDTIQETDLDKSILLRSLGVSVPLADIYENIIF